MSPGSGPMEGHLCIYVCTHASCASALAGRTCRPLKNYRPVIFIKSESGSLTRSIRTSSTWSLFFKCSFAREKARLTYRRLCVFCFAFVYLNVWVDTVKKGCIFRRKRIRKKNDIFNFTFTSINMCLRWWFDLIIFFFWIYDERYEKYVDNVRKKRKSCLNGLTFVTFDGLSIDGNWRRSCERPREKWSLCKFIQARVTN